MTSETNQNNQAWQRYIAAKCITFDQPFYTVDAVELKSITGREPRLLAKYDTPQQLAKPIRDAGYTLLPVRNGQYIMAPGNFFVTVPRCATVESFLPRLPFPLVTEGRSSGEAQYIDQAFNSGLLAHFLETGPMYLTIRGREFTKQFDFQLNNLNLHTESVQIEVDAGYEALHDIALVEAKIGLPDCFNIRQLYYPFRHYSIIAPQKRVRSVFLAYDIPSTSYFLYEYIFQDPGDPISVEMAKGKVFKLAPQTKLAIHDLIDSRFSTDIPIVPQADDLNKVFELLTLVEAEINTSEQVAEYFGFEERQSSYYREAAEYLGLVKRVQHEYELTETGILVLAEPPEKQAFIFAKVMINTWIFRALVDYASKYGCFGLAEIEAVIRSLETSEGISRYSGSTIGRRRQTILSWAKWLANEIGCFSYEGNVFRLA